MTDSLYFDSHHMLCSHHAIDAVAVLDSLVSTKCTGINNIAVTSMKAAHLLVETKAFVRVCPARGRRSAEPTPSLQALQPAVGML